MFMRTSNAACLLALASWGLLALAGPAPTEAAMVELTTADGDGADAKVEGNWVDSDGVTTEDRSGDNYGGEGTLVARHYDQSGGADYERYEKGYLRFDLPSDVDTVTDANLDLFYTRGNNRDGIVTVYGLAERSGDDYGTGSLGENWGEGAITWANAPGNVDAIDGSAAYGLDATYVTELFTFETNGSDPGVSIVANDAASDTSAARQALVDFLNADTDGLVTFVLISGDASSDSAHANTFAAKEFTDAADDYTGEHAPRLDLAYTPVPEPATLALLALGGLGVAIRRRR